jgi:hypothetical protein
MLLSVFSYHQEKAKPLSVIAFPYDSSSKVPVDD